MDNMWWGYLHVNGSIQAKRYFDKQDIREAMESDFVLQVHGPFMCADRGSAIQVLTRHLKGE